MHVAIFPGLMSTFFDWENFPSLSERLASYELWGSFETLSSSFPITSVGKLLLRFGFGLNPLSSPPPLTDVFLLAGLVLFWACPQFSFCLGNQTLIPFWFRIRSGTCGRRSSVQVPVGYVPILCVFIIFRLVRKCEIFPYASCPSQKLLYRFPDLFIVLKIL